MNSVIRFVFALFIMVGTSSVLAQDEAQAKQYFERLDTNGDGQITSDEVPEERKQQFERGLSRIDLNQDGKVNFEEFYTRIQASRRGSGIRKKGDRPQNSRSQNSEARKDSVRRRPNENTPPAQRSRTPQTRSSSRSQASSPIFRLLDTDRDGQLTKQEMNRIGDVLGRLDRDGDDQVSMREIAAALGASGGGAPRNRSTDRPTRPVRPESDQPRRSRNIRTPRSSERDAPTGGVFGRLDKNNDGKVSRDEIPAMLRRRFDEVDRDNDGILSSDEFKTMLERARNRRPQGSNFQSRFPGRPGGFSDRRVTENREAIAKLMREYDRDADGQISRDEAPERIKGQFGDLDKNDNGFLNPAELANAAKSLVEDPNS